MSFASERTLSFRFWRPLPAAAICLAAAGCTTIPDIAIGPTDAPRVITSQPDANAKAEAFKQRFSLKKDLADDPSFRKRVEGDSFPEAGAAN